MGGVPGVQEACGDRAEDGRRRAVLVRRPRRRVHAAAGPRLAKAAVDASPPPDRGGGVRRAAALPLQAGAGVPPPPAQPGRLLASAAPAGEPQTSLLHCSVLRRGFQVRRAATADDGPRRLHDRRRRR